MITVSYIQLIEDGAYKGMVFCKKSNKFVIAERWNEVVKYLSMTENNAKTDCEELKRRGFNCRVSTVCIEDDFGECAYEI